MPSRKNADGTYRDIAHPITAAFRAEVEEAVLRAFEEAKENMPAEEEA